MKEGESERFAGLAGALWLVASGVSGCASPVIFHACDMSAAGSTAPSGSTSQSKPVPIPTAARIPTAAAQTRTGLLVVYSATYVPTSEQSEYPVYSDYTITTMHGEVIERVANGTGPFKGYPAKVTLASGEYHIRAQYDRGGLIDFPVVIEPGKITTVNLDNEPLRTAGAFVCEPIRLPGGRAVGWRAISGAE
jgi:hypothetical protein